MDQAQLCMRVASEQVCSCGVGLGLWGWDRHSPASPVGDRRATRSRSSRTISAGKLPRSEQLLLPSGLLTSVSALLWLYHLRFLWRLTPLSHLVLGSEWSVCLVVTTEAPISSWLSAITQQKTRKSLQVEVVRRCINKYQIFEPQHSGSHDERFIT